MEKEIVWVQGTTPSVQYPLPFDSDVLKSAELTVEYYSGSSKNQIVKSLRDSVCEGQFISFSFTQEETLKIPAPSTVKLQLRVLTFDNVALATIPCSVQMENLLKGGVIA